VPDVEEVVHDGAPPALPRRSTDRPRPVPSAQGERSRSLTYFDPFDSPYQIAQSLLHRHQSRDLFRLLLCLLNSQLRLRQSQEVSYRQS
jgi:hypothetical protein